MLWCVIIDAIIMITTDFKVASSKSEIHSSRTDLCSWRTLVHSDGIYSYWNAPTKKGISSFVILVSDLMIL